MGGSLEAAVYFDAVFSVFDAGVIKAEVGVGGGTGSKYNVVNADGFLGIFELKGDFLASVIFFDGDNISTSDNHNAVAMSEILSEGSAGFFVFARK